MPVLCSVNDLKIDYELSQPGLGRKCLISIKNEKKKLGLEKASFGDGFAQYYYLYKQGPGRTNRWAAKITLDHEIPVQWTSTDSATGGESIQISLGEKSRLFACSGFIRGNLEGTIRAPALNLRISGKDVWIFLLYFETDGSRNYEIQCEKDKLSLSEDALAASATMRTEQGSSPRLLASLESTGVGGKRVALVLDRAIGKGSLQDSIQQDFMALKVGENFKEGSWSPVRRETADFLWIFPNPGLISHRGPLKDMLEALGAKVNRSMFADNLGGNEMDDFIISDDPTMSYQLGLVLEGDKNSQVSDWMGLRFKDISRTVKEV